MLKESDLKLRIAQTARGDMRGLQELLNNTILPTEMGTKNTAAAVVNTIAVEETGLGNILHQTKFVCTATPVSLSLDAGVALYGGVKLYDLPEGAIMTLGAVIDGSLSAPTIADDADDAWDGYVGLGTATAGTGATLASTEQDILQTTALTTAVANVAVCDAVSAASALTESGARHFDGTSTAKDVFLNFCITYAATMLATTAYFTGTVTLTWIKLGDK